MICRTSPNVKDAYKLFHDGSVALAQVERTGMCIDVDYCMKAKEDLTNRIVTFTDDFKKTDMHRAWKIRYSSSILNINSDDQLRKVLVGDMGLTTKNKTKGGKLISVNAEDLKELNFPDVLPLLEIRKLQKLRDTYLSGFLREQVGGVMHPFYNLNTVVTFRGSSSNPNFQNIPKRDAEAMSLIRRAIIPRPGHQLLEVDFSGIEVRVGACYHKDARMLRYINDSTTDMHRDMAIQLFKLKNYDGSHKGDKLARGAAKNGFVFPQFYGDYFKTCAVNLRKWQKSFPEISTGSLKDHLKKNKIHSATAFEAHVKKVEHDFWYNRFDEYRQWKDRHVREYQKKGYVDMLTGFRCSGIMRKNEVINYPVQGSAFHCLLWCLIQIVNQLRDRKLKTRVIGQIHDALVFDVHPDELEVVLKLVKLITTVRLLDHFAWIIVPMEVEAELCAVDAPWSEKQDIELPQVRARKRRISDEWQKG